MFQIPLAYLLARPLGYGVHGVFWAIPIAEVLIALAGVYFFRRGAWRTRMV
jgi:Na+-driven multidrug efflux pump